MNYQHTHNMDELLYADKNHNRGCLQWGVGLQRGGLVQKGTFGVTELVRILTGVEVTQVCTFFKIH